MQRAKIQLAGTRVTYKAPLKLHPCRAALALYLSRRLPARLWAAAGCAEVHALPRWLLFAWRGPLALHFVPAAVYDDTPGSGEH